MKLSQMCYFLVGLFSSLSVQAASPVWLIEKDDNLLFLGGTIHLLEADDYPLPKGFEGAYKHSDVLVFESDIGAMSQPAFGQQLAEKLTYSAGGSLRQDLSAETYRAVEQFFNARGVPMGQIDVFKPGMVSMMMTIVELQRMGHAEAGVDEFFFSKTVKDNKQRQWFETIDEQIEFLVNLGVGQEDAMIQYTLDDLTRLPKMWQDAKDAWAVGDLDRLDQLAAKDWRIKFPGVYRKLVINRNNSWMGKITQMLETRPVEMVLVGALHLSGEQGLLRQLADRGYQVRRLK